MILFFLVVLGIFVGDQILKREVEKRLKRGEEKPLLGGKLLLRRVYNKGAALNLLDEKPGLVRRISEVIGVGLLIWDLIIFRKKGRFLEKAGLAFLTGGALSNAWDRTIRGKVIDYFGFKTRWEKVTDITYNIADIFIFVGSFLAVIGTMINGKK